MAGSAPTSPRDDLDAGRFAREAPLPGGEGRTCRHARSARDRRPARSPSARQPRPSPSRSRAARSTGSRSASAPRLTPTTPREAIAQSDRRPSGAEIEARLPDFTGDIEQVPPRYSALKVDGSAPTTSPAARRSSSLRRGACRSPGSGSAAIPTRTARCSRRGAARALMCGRSPAISAARFFATAMSKPCAGPVGAFGEDSAVTLAALEALAERGHDALVAALQPVETALADIPALAVSGPDADRLRRGQPVLLRAATPRSSKAPSMPPRAAR